jgi:hypothetical protein
VDIVTTRRRAGYLLQKQFYDARLAGNTTLYVAPVDEKTPQAATAKIVK